MSTHMLMYWLLSTALAQSIEAAPGEYLIKLKGGKSAQSIQAKVAGKVAFKGQVQRGNVYHLKLDNSQDFQTLSNDPDVEYIEPNFMLAKIPIVPGENANSTGQGQQIFSEGEVQALASTSYSQNYAPVQVLQSWGIQASYNVNNVPVVAVIDTGVNLNHSVFTESQAIWRNAAEIANNGVDDDFNGYVDDINGWNFNGNVASPMDDDGHGSHVAGIVVGAGIDIFSAPRDQSRVQIMALKFLDASGAGRTSDAIRAIYYAVDNGAKVINCSWGGGSYSRALLEALTYAYERQVVVITAAGNSGANIETSPMYPAAYDVPSNIAVAASTDSDNLASFSNYGKTKVAVAAPGYYIYSTHLGTNNYTLMSGTSMAAPFVAGIAAYAWREAPQLTGYQVKQMVLSTVNVRTNLANKVSTQGRVNAFNLINLAKASTSVAASQPAYKPTAIVEAAASGGAGGCGLVKAISNTGGPGGSLFAIGVTLFAFLLPFGVWLTFFMMSPQQRRKYERFNVSSDIKVKLGDREITGHMNSLSQGGLSFSAEDMIEKGSLVTMKITNPNGKGEIEVQGRIVWSEEKAAYGVQFQNASKSLFDRVLSWTRKSASDTA